jgi:hypothetical protein
MYYRRGPISTYRQWSNPSIENIKLWYQSIKPIIESTKLQCNLMGRTVYDIENTKDLDIGYTGAYDNIQQLEYLLIMSTDMGFRYNMLVDCKWTSSTQTIVDYKPKDIDFIFLDYYEQDDGYGTRIIRNYRLHPKYQVVGDCSVRGNFLRNNPALKQHQIKYIQEHGELPTMLIQDFIKE